MSLNSTLREDIENVINRHCAENGSDTPDYILADYLVDCLRAFDSAVRARNAWYNQGEAASPIHKVEVSR